MRWRHWIAVMGLAMGCDSAESAGGNDDLYMDDDVPSGNCMGETGPCMEDESGEDGDAGTDTAQGGGTMPAGSICESTSQCDAGLSCLATFDGDIGEFECQSACIEDDDETRWCIDDASCCNESSVCADRGYCRPIEGSDASTGEEADTETGTGDSTSDGGTTETGG